MLENVEIHPNYRSSKIKEGDFIDLENNNPLTRAVIPPHTFVILIGNWQISEELNFLWVC